MARTKISKERRENLTALAKMMRSQGTRQIYITPELIDCFDAVITPEENEFLLRMGREPQTFGQLAKLSDLPEDQFRPFLETMSKKGLIWSEFKENGEEIFKLAPILVGWFEMYLCDGEETPEKKEFARRVEEFVKSAKKINVFPLRNLLNYRHKRTSVPHTSIFLPKPPSERPKTVEIKVDQSLKSSDMEVYPAKDVYELIEKYGDENKIALVHCFCRYIHKTLDEPCRFKIPMESCIALGSIVDYGLKYGKGRLITKEEALEILADAADKGAIQQVFHEKDDINRPEFAICNCCWDCCEVIGAYNRGLIPLRFKSYYAAEITDGDGCTGCGTCVKFCPVRATSVIDKKSRIDEEMCIGCGQCELQCPEGVISLRYEEREVILPMLKSSEARIQT